MLEAIEKIETYTAGSDLDDLAANPMALEAVVWNLAVLGEAAGQIPEEITAAYPEVPWPQIRGARNRIIHGYDRIDLSIVWNLIRYELQPLRAQFEQIQEETED